MTEEGSTLKQRLIGRLPPRLRGHEFLRFLRYLVAGGLTTAVNLGVFTLLYHLLHVEFNMSNIVAVLCSVVFAYAVNKRFVFRTHCVNRLEFFREALSFFSARAITIVLEIGGGYFLVDIMDLHNMLGLDEFWIKTALTVIVVLLNYLLSKVLVFRKSK